MIETADIGLPHGAGALTVSQLTRYLKSLVETDDIMSSLSVRGEVSEFSRAASGHLYFAIKDASSQISCVMFRREASRQPDEIAELRKGISVVIHGFLTVYEPRTQCQVYVERVAIVGEGAFQQQFDALKARLDREGLFSAERKRPIPPFPRKIALVTSPGSQAYHDVLHRLRTQCPLVSVIEAGVSVQGDRAPGEIVMALDIVNRMTDAELILLVRGGGSPEDLAAFSDERVARAIFASRIPVITGLGHETDYTIADFVADRRAATPSLAAAEAVPDIAGLVRLSAELHADATYAIQQHIREDRARWLESNRALLAASPRNRLRDRHMQLDDLCGQSERAIEGVLRGARVQLDSLKSNLAALDPLAILARGYAVLTDESSGRVIASVSAVNEGDRLTARVADGAFVVRVEGR